MAPPVTKPRAIVDRKALIARLDEIGRKPVTTAVRRAEMVLCLKSVLAQGHDEVRRRFLEGASDGGTAVAENAFLIDQIIRCLYDYTVTYAYPRGVGTTGERIAVMATGGYGRAELAPFSDIDLLFLLDYKSTPWAEQVVEFMLYALWDMGLKVGHATRTVADCIRQSKADLTVRTALLEARRVWGEVKLAREFHRRFNADVIGGSGPSFVEAKLAERDARHQRMGESRYVLEPNIKEGKGGLRDLQTLLWIARYLFGTETVAGLIEKGVLTADEGKRFQRAHQFLLTVRCHLHYLTGREEDRLTFDLQPGIAARLGYHDRASARSVERFMRHYFLVAKDVGDLTRILCAVLEEQQKRRPVFRRLAAPFLTRNLDGFVVEGSRINVPDPKEFRRDPLRMLTMFAIAHAEDLDVHPHALRAVTENLKKVRDLRDDPEANRLFLEILTGGKDPEPTLRRLSEAGLLGAFIPDFGRVVAQMQYDMYHVYTTDEHTIRALGILHRIEKSLLAEELPVATSIVGKVASRRALYVATMLHDIAKGRGGDHSDIGAEIALDLGPRLGLTDEETETVSWLVRHHLLMSRTAQKRDLDDPKTISDFVSVVQSPERLKLLLVLTCADIRAVGPEVWNGWKASLLRELYYRADEALTGGLGAQARDQRVARRKEALRAVLDSSRDPAYTPEEVEAHLARGYPDYWLSFDTETHVRHAHLVIAAERAARPLTVEALVDEYRAVTEITVYAADHPGLFSKIAGALALGGATIVDAKIVTLANGMALDTFSVQDAQAEAVERRRVARLEETITKALTGRVDLAKELARKPSGLPARAKVFRVPPRVIVDNQASKTHTVIEVNGHDRPGFLFDVTRTLTNAGVQIASAVVTTYGERAVDVFYVKDVFGMKIEHEGKLREVRRRLREALAEIPADEQTAPEAEVLPYRPRSPAVNRRPGARAGGQR